MSPIWEPTPPKPPQKKKKKVETYPQYKARVNRAASNAAGPLSAAGHAFSPKPNSGGQKDSAPNQTQCRICDRYASAHAR